jgi:hypothetical protein
MLLLCRGGGGGIDIVMNMEQGHSNDKRKMLKSRRRI